MKKKLDANQERYIKIVKAYLKKVPMTPTYNKKKIDNMYTHQFVKLLLILFHYSLSNENFEKYL